MKSIGAASGTDEGRMWKAAREGRFILCRLLRSLSRL